MVAKTGLFIWDSLDLINGRCHYPSCFSFVFLVFCTDGITLSLYIYHSYWLFWIKAKRDFFTGHDTNQFINIHKAKKYGGSGLKESDALLYVEKLKNLMEAEKPFLNPNLNLPQLAKVLEIPSYYLSQVLNNNIEQNFFDFINSYRVEETKAKMADPKYENLSLLGIAFESGFNTKSAFNRVFKKMTGFTPSEYKKRL
ncbi:MAG: helix-turn-helix domain-containing protein [Bacteroidales bacterium]